MVNELTTQINIEYQVQEELPSMIKLFSIQSSSYKEAKMQDFIMKALNEIDGVFYDKDTYGNILVRKGKIKENEYYPCLISHMDTVHDFVSGYKVIAKKVSGVTKLWAESKNTHLQFNSKELTTSTGIGGDDKAGIWLCLKLLQELPILKVVFTVEEEVGAIGANKVSNSFFDNVGYMIEVDRKGNSDVVTDIFDEICSKEFINTIAETMGIYEYSETTGMLTDIATIRENGVEISAVNVSVGYYNPHSKIEYVIAEDLLKATSFVKSCIRVLGHNLFIHKNIEYPRYKYDRMDYYDFDDDYSSYKGYYAYNSCTCSKNLIDFSCDIHNKILKKYSGEICTCGEELEEREYSYNCPFCNKIYTI